MQGKQQELFGLFVSNLRDQMEKSGKIKINQDEMKALTRRRSEPGNVAARAMSFPRAAGILLHPTSLPSRGGIGDFGPAAYQFVDFLASARQGLWQVLPLGPLGYGNSPYSSTSAFAGNPLLISLERLADHGWIDGAQLDASQD